MREVVLDIWRMFFHQSLTAAETTIRSVSRGFDFRRPTVFTMRRSLPVRRKYPSRLSLATYMAVTVDLRLQQSSSNHAVTARQANWISPDVLGMPQCRVQRPLVRQLRDV